MLVSATTRTCSPLSSHPIDDLLSFLVVHWRKLVLRQGGNCSPELVDSSPGCLVTYELDESLFGEKPMFVRVSGKILGKAEPYFAHLAVHHSILHQHFSRRGIRRGRPGGGD